MLVGLSLGFVPAMEATAQDFTYTPEFTADKELKLPQGEIWREWIYIGTPLTPNSLNDGAAPFPEFHSVYIEPGAYAHYQ